MYEYIKLVNQEALRFKSPAGATTSYTVDENCHVGGYDFKKGDKMVFVIHYGLHHNSSQWQKPFEFLPDRFDPNSPLFLKPDGKKRNSYSFFPFSGGQRVCAGKVMAEYNLRILSIYLSELFDFEYVNPEKYEGLNNYPESIVFQSKTVPIEVYFKKRE